MDRNELARRLAAEGCNPSNYTIGRGGSDAFCLHQTDGLWTVFYTERGLDWPPIFESADEDDACRFFLDKILSMRHDHCVGIFRSQRKARALAARLEHNRVEAWQDEILYSAPDDMRYRVFVTGKAVFEAGALLGELPLGD